MACRRALPVSILMVVVILCAPGLCPRAAGPDTALLAAAADPYHALAEEIARDSGLPLYGTVDAALAAEPTYLVWVAAPAGLTEAALWAFGRDLDEAGTAVAVGIISGRTVDEARALWERGQTPAAEAGRYAVVSGSKRTDPGRGITWFAGGAREAVLLTKAALMDTLARANVVQISIEGAAGLWFDVGTGITVRAADIPALPDSLIQVYGCSTLRPSAPDSIALACVGQGARAYCGFVFNSVPGTRFGDYTDIDLRYTWAGFAIGQMVQIQNQAAMQAYAAAPHFYMLGDPRIHCGTADAPYEVVSDREGGGRRVIDLAGMPAGVIPVRIAGGAGHDFVQVSGLNALAAGSRHFNRDVQMVDIAGDKYLAFDNAGGRDRVTITLRGHAPWYWRVLDAARAVVDWKAFYGLGSELNGYLGLAALLALAAGKARRMYTWRHLALSLVPAALLAALWLGYLWAYGDRIPLTNAPLMIEWWAVAGLVVSVAFGALLYLRAARPAVRIAALFVPNLSSAALLGVLVLAFIVRAVVTPGGITIDRPGYPLTRFAFDLLSGLLLYGALFGLFRRIVGRRRRPDESR